MLATLKFSPEFQNSMAISKTWESSWTLHPVGKTKFWEQFLTQNSTDGWYTTD